MGHILLLSLTLSGLLGGGHWEKAKIGQVALAPAPVPPPRAWDLSGRGRDGGHGGGRGRSLPLKCHWVGAAAAGAVDAA